MCRFAGALGPPHALSSLVLDAERSLEVQAWDPRQQVSGHVNVDGTGIAWWQPDEPRPLRYVSERPPWSDPNLRSLLPRLCASIHLAVVRGATPGQTGGLAATPPFVEGPLALAHNGYLEGFRDRSLRALLDPLPADLLARLDVVTDTAVILLHVAHALRSHPSDLASAVATALRRVGEAVAEVQGVATLNVLAGDGRTLVASRHALRREADSLVVRRDDPLTGGTVVASEPLDTGEGWESVPEDVLVIVDPSGVRLRELESRR